MMYETVKKYIPAIICLLCVLTLQVRGSYYRHKYNEQCTLVAEYRRQLDEARVRSDYYAEYLKSAKEANRELGTVLSRSTTTLATLREQLRAVKQAYEAMENMLSSVSFNDSDTDSVIDR